jgi:toxin ParE1/3/4
VTARRLVKSPQADADLAAIWRESAEQHGRAHADQFIERIYGRFDLLAGNPGLGVRRPWISAGLHLHFQPPPLVIAYRFTDEELRVLRVFHGKRDYEVLLREP